MNKVFKLNETVFISYLSILVYGIYGIMNPNIVDLRSNTWSLTYFLLPIISLAFYLFFQKINKKPELSIKINFSCLDKVFALRLTIFLAISFLVSYLINLSLTGDELFYSLYAFIHSTQILSIVSTFSNLIDNIDASKIVRIISFTIFLGLGMLFYLLNYLKKNNYYLFFVSSIIFLIIPRIALSFLGGNEVAHAPLTAFFSMAFTTIFGVSDITFQAGQFLVFLSLSYFIYLRLYSHNSSKFISTAITLSLFTIPAFFFLGSVLEPVLWSIVCYTVVLCYLCDDKFKKYKLLVFFVVLLSFFRIASIFALFPIFIHIVINGNLLGSMKNKLTTLINVFSPTIVFIPFFIFANTKGTAATIESEISFFKLFEIFSDGTMWSLYADVLPLFVLIIYMSLILISIRSKFSQLNISYFFFLSLIFFALDENVWPFPKYKLEVFIPLIISLTVSIMNKIDSSKVMKAIGSLCFFIFTLNSYSILNFPSSCSPNLGDIEPKRLSYRLDFGCNYLTKVPYNFSSAIDYVSSKESLPYTYIPGVYNGSFIHVLNKASVSDFLLADNIWEDQQRLNNESIWWGYDANTEAIDKDLRIKFVLIGYTANMPTVRDSLISKGWSIVYSDKNKFGLMTLVLKRPAL